MCLLSRSAVNVLIEQDPSRSTPPLAGAAGAPGSLQGRDAMNIHRIQKLLSRRAAARFMRDRRGNATVEFAFLAFPFFMIVLATMEVGLLFFSTAALEGAAGNGARLVRTGQAQFAEMSRDDFVELICDEISGLGDCATRVTVEIPPFESFSTYAPGNAICDASNGDVSFDQGAAGEAMMFRVCMEYDMMTPMIGQHLAPMGDGKLGLVSTTVFRNEPFGELLDD